MTVPIYITAAILAVIVAWTSDRVGKRSPFIVAFLCVMVVGFSMLVISQTQLVDTSLTLTQVHFYQQPKGCLWRSFHRSLRHLPSVSRSYLMVGQQPVRKLQAKCWYGYTNWCWKPWRRKCLFPFEFVQSC